MDAQYRLELWYKNSLGYEGCAFDLRHLNMHRVYGPIEGLLLVFVLEGIDLLLQRSGQYFDQDGYWTNYLQAYV